MKACVDSTLLSACLMFMVKQHNSFLIFALLSQIKLCRDNALFGGHFGPKFDGWGHTNIFEDRVAGSCTLPMDWWVAGPSLDVLLIKP